MSHKYEIQQKTDGKYLLYEMSNLGMAYISEHPSLEAAELGMLRLISPRTWKYDAEGDEVE